MLFSENVLYNLSRCSNTNIEVLQEKKALSSIITRNIFAITILKDIGDQQK